MKLTHEQINDVIYDIQGTCKSLAEIVYASFGVEPEELENEMELCNEIDNRIFECSCCGWWFEAGDWVDQGDDYNGEELCTGCGQEQGYGD